ncbi:2-oxoglutarate dehydrogenase E1 component [Kouleothrix sp.]|uniref:2-oxoglutarate dehydrogenase E1 component n=1 Tax=Kouleothrix sp. TaxID=2779161 RepID=UPI00391B6416
MTNLSMFHGPNAGYVLELYERYQRDPLSVDAATRAAFERWAPPEATPASAPAASAPAAPAAPAPAAAQLDVTRTVAAARLIRYIRELGHLDARIDPLGSDPPGDLGLQLSIHGVDEEFLAGLPASIVRGPLAAESHNALEGVEKLRAAYSGSIGYETDHIQNFEERSWIREAIESRQFFYGFVSDRRRRELLMRLTEVETFERFLHTNFVGQKRFSLEGCDMLVPMLDSIIRNAALLGTHEVVIGMAHRGRLNVLAHTLGKPYDAILAEFHAANRSDGASPSGKGSVGWAGDVKYHLGAQRTYRESGIESMPITLAPNPSHLEFVNPVVEGRARAAQEQRDRPGAPEQSDRASLAILIHGDAAFPGQGVVAETLNMSRLKGYRTGGTIHIITNNQIGFTTEPSDSRSTLYASDLAKGFEIPIVHVNADDVEACIAVARMAHAYREQFGKDFVIDLVGYRRWGHNEGDEPAFTQPKMYTTIANHATVRQIWADRLIADGLIDAAEAERMIAEVTEKLQQARREAETKPHEDRRPKPAPPGLARRTQTAVPAERLQMLNAALLNRPAGFTINSRLERTLERRRSAFELENGIDWGHAEALAFASILADGIPIRITGQDSERGTFSHRHAVLRDTSTGQAYTPLQTLPQAKASFAIHNSPLSEVAVLGFEYGYSSHAPNTLVLWEAQFGDFANGAQVIIDQFIVSGRAKWSQLPALVLLLPHGYEGQGPEHSSARLERYLQLAADENLRVANCTSAGQYFHLLRRQAALLTSDPRPLIVMSPKSLLRHPRAGSSLHDLAEGHFQRVIDDPTGRERAADVTRLVLCSGKVYIDLLGAPEANSSPSVAVARVEELYSFPEAELRSLLEGYPHLLEVVWLQEEPRNMGAWGYIAPRLRALLPPDLPLLYVGRGESATPAEGSLVEHTLEQARIIALALQGQLQPAVGSLP